MRAHNLGAVISFEFLRTVRKPRFWLISLSVPLLIAVVVGLITISSQITADRADSQDKQSVTFTYTDASGLIDAKVAAAAGGTPVTDAAAARAAGRDALGMYLGLSNYVRSWRRLGFGDDDVAPPGSDRLIDAVVAHGTAAQIAEQLGAHLAAGADQAAIQVLGGREQLVPTLAELAGPLGLSPAG